MNTVIHRKQEGFTGEAVVEMFKDELTKKQEQYQTSSEIEKYPLFPVVIPTLMSP